jgi:hypothetical protein
MRLFSLLIHFGFFLFASTAPMVGAPLMTEFQASNSATLSDEDGDQSDWIELFNPDPVAVDLTAC